MKTLHLVLKGHWYDKIASGEKTSEYRACTPYWNKRLPNMVWHDEMGCWVRDIRTPRYDRVIFHRGYTAETMEFEIKSIDTTTQPNDLGLDRCWEIKLGQRIK